MVKKAKFLYKHNGVLWYEYRGHDYIVNPQLWTSTAAQHRMEQSKIDAEIEKEEMIAKRDAEKEHRYEDTAEYGFEVFWNSVQ